MVEEFHPRRGLLGQDDPSRFKRSDAQLMIARLYGFGSWARLRDHLRLVDEFARPDPADGDPEVPADRFVSLACVSYGDDDVAARLAIGRRMLEDDPGLSAETVAAMATAGNHRLLAERHATANGLVHELCGPQWWPPLLYATYSRIEEPDHEVLGRGRIRHDHRWRRTRLTGRRQDSPRV